MTETRQHTVERLLRLVVHDTQRGCWLWCGSTQPNGYGAFSYRGRKRLAHRVSYELHHGAIPDGHDVHHTCSTRRCVNPDHLQALTHRENLLTDDTLAARHAARTHCPHGHPYDDANTYTYRGQRQCKECRRRRNRERSARRTAERRDRDRRMRTNDGGST